LLSILNSFQDHEVLGIIADNLSKAGWSWGCVSAVDRGDGKRFVVHADEKLTAFLELERAICLQLLREQI
jgi:hypothetical protein